MKNTIHPIFYKWSSICILTGSVLLTTGYWLRPYIEKEFVSEFAGEQALLSTILVAIGILLLLAGLPAILSKHCSSKANILSGGITFVSIAAFHLGTLSLYFVLPVLVKHSSETRALLASDAPPFPYFAIFWAMSLLLQCLGVLWFGISIWKAKVYPSGAAILFVAGALILFVAPILNFRLLQPATTLIMAGMSWCAITLLRDTMPRQETKILKETQPLP